MSPTQTHLGVIIVPGCRRSTGAATAEIRHITSIITNVQKYRVIVINVGEGKQPF